ncbi:hypothetical protein HGP28_02635 [Vibrio sp. SM6]|uniref:Uncharacterized protein n=1 Tax=Vibrio agarilyticus TaxID=2726741 RepID=A0A7X8YFQ0_9VIBR|nr:hypothetical protein [Vibrio agarilyticus]NLS11785.1 hypothetical protein [Vibrio agarilyticus]
MPTYTLDRVISQTTFWSHDHKRNQIEELIEQADLAKDELNRFMQTLSNKVNNESGKRISYIRGPLKTRERIAAKCGITQWDNPSTDKTSGVKKPLEVKDIARSTIVFRTVAQMLAFRDYIYTTPEYQALKDKQTPAVKDLWAVGIQDQYKDVKFFLQVEINFSTKVNNVQMPKQKIPHIVELQLNVCQMAWGKTYGHAFYNLSRLARIDGEEKFVWDDPQCVITVPGNIKGKVGDKLRTAITHCRSIACGDQHILLATNILSKLISNNLKLPSARERETLPAAKHYSYKNGVRPLVIQCGPYAPEKQANQDSGPAQAWAISHLASFIWANFTKSQAKPGVTGTAANWHAQG